VGAAAGADRTDVAITSHFLANRTAVALASQLGARVAEFPGDHGGFAALPEQFGRVLDQVLNQSAREPCPTAVSRGRSEERFYPERTGVLVPSSGLSRPAWLPGAPGGLCILHVLAGQRVG
jgi:hypothetical protein